MYLSPIVAIFRGPAVISAVAPCKKGFSSSIRKQDGARHIRGFGETQRVPRVHYAHVPCMAMLLAWGTDKACTRFSETQMQAGVWRAPSLNKALKG